MFVVISIPANYVDVNLAVQDYFSAMIQYPTRSVTPQARPTHALQKNSHIGEIGINIQEFDTEGSGQMHREPLKFVLGTCTRQDG